MFEVSSAMQKTQSGSGFGGCFGERVEAQQRANHSPTSRQGGGFGILFGGDWKWESMTIGPGGRQEIFGGVSIDDVHREKAEAQSCVSDAGGDGVNL